MSVEATAEAALKAPVAAAKGFSSVFKSHPVAAGLVALAVIVIAFRYRASILSALNLIPVAGPAAARFAR